MHVVYLKSVCFWMEIFIKRRVSCLVVVGVGKTWGKIFTRQELTCVGLEQMIGLERAQ